LLLDAKEVLTKKRHISQASDSVWARMRKETFISRRQRESIFNIETYEY